MGRKTICPPPLVFQGPAAIPLCPEDRSGCNEQPVGGGSALGGVPVGCGTGTLAVAWPLRFPLLWGRQLGRRGARPFCRPECMRRHGIPSYTVVLHPSSLQKIECAYQSEARQEPARDSQVRVERPARRRSSLWQEIGRASCRERV